MQQRGSAQITIMPTAASLQTIIHTTQAESQSHHTARDIMNIIHSINIVFMFTNMICAMFTKTIIHLYKYTKALVYALRRRYGFILWCCMICSREEASE